MRTKVIEVRLERKRRPRSLQTHVSSHRLQRHEAPSATGPFLSSPAPPQRLFLAFHWPELGHMATPEPITDRIPSQGVSPPPPNMLLNTVGSASKGKK